MHHIVGISRDELIWHNEATGEFCHEDQPGMADACLVPQLYNARRWNVDISDYSEIVRIDAACNTLSAFLDAALDRFILAD